MNDHFDILLLLARPGAGKSEIIRFLKEISDQERLQDYHIGPFEEIDDFPMLWTWFEEDHLLEEMGYLKLHTDQEGYFLYPHLWNLLIERICLEYQKKMRDHPDYHLTKTVVMEFSRGSEHGGYAKAFRHIQHQVASRMAILYVDVSWEESLRKNRRRFNPDKPDSILEHSLPDSKLKRLYEKNDWDEITTNNLQTITIQGVKVPYVVMPNEDDVTTEGGPKLAARLKEALDPLWQNYLTR